MLKSEATILLADDDSNDVFFMRRAFEKARLLNPLRVVADGEAAIQYLSGEGEFGNREKFPLPSLLLLDLRMPRKSGFEVLQWVRKQPGLRRLPIVVLTSSRNGPDVNRAYDLGANSYLMKPPGAEALRDMLEGFNGYWLASNHPPESLEG